MIIFRFRAANVSRHRAEKAVTNEEYESAGTIDRARLNKLVAGSESLEPVVASSRLAADRNRLVRGRGVDVLDSRTRPFGDYVHHHATDGTRDFGRKCASRR